MARYINLTPHAIAVYTENAFSGLTQVNPTTWVADVCYDDQPVGLFASEGCARISVETTEIEDGPGNIPMVESVYGDATGIPDNVQDDDILIVSLPMLSMLKASGHERANQCVSPYRVVRDAANGSVVFGCMGFSK